MGELLGIARFTFREGMLDDFKRLSAEAVGIARTMDTGTLQYDVFLSEDQSECIVIERYKDSSSLMEHAAHVGHLMGPLFATAEVSSEMLGEPSAEIRAQITSSKVRLFTPFLSL